MFTTTTTSWTSFVQRLNPEAFITVKKNRVKLYDNNNNNPKIYFKDNQNFEIELFNPSHNAVLAKIWLNDKLISPSGIIVQASERVYLERFIDSPEKLSFKCFEVDNVPETKKQREKINGKVKVAFYDSIPQVSVTSTWASNTNRNLLLDSNSGRITYNTNTLGLTSFNPCGEISLSSPNEQIETGRVVNGGRSNQVFESGTGNFQNYSFACVEYQILPESLKPVSLREVRQYCVDCGSRIKKSSWKFCPTCGCALQ